MEGGRRREKKWIRGLCGGESLMLDDSYYVHSHGKSLSFLPLRICLKENHYSGLILLVIVHQFPITALFILNNSVFRRKSFRIASAFSYARSILSTKYCVLLRMHVACDVIECGHAHPTCVRFVY